MEENQGMLNEQPAMEPEAPVEASPISQESGLPKDEITEFVSAGMSVIHSEETRGQVAGMLKSGQGPIKSVADVALKVVEMVETQAKRGGKKFGDEVIMAGASYLIPQIVEVGEASGAFKEMNDEEIKLATGRATSEYINKRVESGELTKEQLIAMNADIEAQAQAEGSDQGQSAIKSTQAPPNMQGMLEGQGAQ